MSFEVVSRIRQHEKVIFLEGYISCQRYLSNYLLDILEFGGKAKSLAENCYQTDGGCIFIREVDFEKELEYLQARAYAMDVCPKMELLWRDSHVDVRSQAGSKNQNSFGE